jgi:hypothetical protein
VLPNRDDNPALTGGGVRESSPDSFRIENVEPEIDLELDYVGSMENAAKIIAASRPGGKR